MEQKPVFFPVIDPAATGANIMKLRKERCLTVRDLQHYFGFEEPQAIYKWQHGQSLPSIDNLYALSALLEVPMDAILVPRSPRPAFIPQQKEQQELVPAALPICLQYSHGAARGYLIQHHKPGSWISAHCCA